VGIEKVVVMRIVIPCNHTGGYYHFGGHVASYIGLKYVSSGISKENEFNPGHCEGWVV
jgi:hypothetical protein